MNSSDAGAPWLVLWSAGHTSEHPLLHGGANRAMRLRQIKIIQWDSERNQFLNGDVLPSANVNGVLSLSPGAFLEEKR